MSTQAKWLRNRLANREILPVPGVYDALTARMASYCGFEAVYMTGYATAASFGYPDFGLLTMTEMVENARRIADSVSLPLIADADTGYGNAINVYRTVREYERAGVAAVQLEDQTWPKRCGHMESKQVIEAENMVGKIKAAVDARQDQSTILIIRTDAAATHGMEEALERALSYADAGADVLFVEVPLTAPDMREVPVRLPKPCLINMVFGHDEYDLASLSDMGYALAIYPGIALLGALEGMHRMCINLRENGRSVPPKEGPFDFDELNRFLGMEKYRELERKYTLTGKGGLP